MTRPTLNRGALRWCGEHWINALSDTRDEDSGDQPSAWFSLYHTRYCEVGEGNVLHLVVPSAGITVICSDNPALRTWVADRFLSKSTVGRRMPRSKTPAFSAAGQSGRSLRGWSSGRIIESKPGGPSPKRR